MKILHFGPVSENKSAGLSFSIPNLIRSQNYANRSEIAYLYNTINGVDITESQIAQYDIVVIHGYFYLCYFKVLLKIAKSAKLIICPRGSFSKSNKYVLKKHLYSLIFFSIIKFRRLKYSFHFLTESEMRRSRFRSKDDFIVGNSIDFKFAETMSEEVLKCKFERKKIVYIGRFSNHIKGLDLLFNLILENKNILQTSNIKIDLYGPDTDDKNQLVRFVKRHNIVNVNFHNEVYGLEKNNILEKSTFHILASRSEGFPMTVLESSSFYTPQILSEGTNLQDAMISDRFGISFNSQIFEEITHLTFDKYKQFALNARVFAEKHSFRKIGLKTNEFYKL